MGWLHAMEYRDRLSLAEGIRMHLTCNHYPPVPESMVPVCIRAIRYARRGKYDTKCKLPVGITWRGKGSAPVSNIIEAHHLHCWLED